MATSDTGTEFVRYTLHLHLTKTTKSYPPTSRYSSDTTTVEPRVETEDMSDFTVTRATVRSCSELTVNHLNQIISEE